MDRKHAVLDAGIPDSLDVLRDAEPQVGCPNLHAKFAVQKDRRRRPSATEVQHPHAGPQVQRRGKPLGDPEGVGPAAGAGDDPFGVVLGRAGKSFGEEPLVRGHVHLTVEPDCAHGGSLEGSQPSDTLSSYCCITYYLSFHSHWNKPNSISHIPYERSVCS